MKAQWHEFYYDSKTDTPEEQEAVWITEEFYEGGVTIGYFDGFTFRTWVGSDDCSVTHWAPIEYPEAPQ